MNAALRCHPAAPSSVVDSLTARVTAAPDGTLTIAYTLTGDLDRIRIPEASAPAFADNLWQHTCFELFAREPGRQAYRELNFSPSSEWAAYAFDGYREGMRNLDMPHAPRIVVQRDARSLRLTAAVALGTRRPELALSAVIEEIDGARSYWALAHPSDKPDFHHADAFTLHLT